MNIRPYKNQDQDDVIQLWQDCALVTPHNNSANDIERKLGVDPDLFLVGVLAGELVATVMGGYEGHRGWINYLAVKPSQRRKGLGAKMMQTVETLLESKGCPKINLQVRKSNTDALAFYASLGYGDDNVIGLGKRLLRD